MSQNKPPKPARRKMATTVIILLVVMGLFILFVILYTMKVFGTS
jgi:hypothetical protein